jgi:hypothetical protein
LHESHVRGNGIGVVGAKAIAAVANELTAIEALDLGGTGVPARLTVQPT